MHLSNQKTLKSSLLLVLCVTIGLCIALAFGAKEYISQQATAQYASDLANELSSRQNTLQRKLNDWQRQISFLYSTPPIQGIVRADENAGVDPFDGTTSQLWIDRLNTIFKGYIENNSDIFQIRYIGVKNKGMEIVRVDRAGGSAEIVPSNKLQNKSKSDYYQAGTKLLPNEIYKSGINLNREYGKVSFPYTKTIRFLYPVHDDKGQLFGLLVINYYADALLDLFSENLNSDIQAYILNSRGEFLLGPDSNMEMATDLGHQHTWDSYFSDSVANLYPSNALYSESELLQDEIMFTQKNIELGRLEEHRWIRLVLLTPLSVIEQSIANQSLPLYAVLAVLFILISGFLFVAHIFLNKKFTLLDTQSEFEAIVKNSYDAVIGVDRNGIVKSWNHAAETIFGFTASYAQGKNLFELVFSHDSAQPMQRKLIDIFAGGVVDSFDAVANKRNGDKLDVSITLSPIVNKDNAISGVAGIMRDVTEQKKTASKLLEVNESLEQTVLDRTSELRLAKDKAIAANKAKGDFVANISHEIRTPMNAILGLAYLLKKQELSPQSLDMVKRIHDAGKSLLGIINDILDFSKIEANRLEIENVPFRLTEVIDNVASIMSTAVGSKPVEVVISALPPEAEFLKGDPLRLRQILINLASNALKFTDEGEVVLKVESVGELTNQGKTKLRFSVTDTGIGIPPEKQKHIFSEFSQADSSTTRTYGGTGLGLTISKKLTSLMGGELQLTSEFGKGSEFYFELPFEVNNKEGNSLPSMVYQRLLIVEQHPTTRELLCDIASSIGWQVNSAGCGQDALKLINEKGVDHYDAVLIDYQLPESGGIPVARAVKGLSEEVNLTVILIISPHLVDSIDEQSNRVIDVVLAKPVTSSSLYNAVLSANKRLVEKTSNDRQLASFKRLKNRSILVVDDSEINREVAQTILEDEGASITTAQNGQEAVDMLVQSPEAFDLVLMDIQMPVLDGYQATAKIRSIPTLVDLPVIALSAGAFKVHQQNAKNAGMSSFVSKPFDVEQLIEEVLKWTPKQENSEKVDVVDTKLDQSHADNNPVNQGDSYSSLVLNITQGLKVWKREDNYLKQLQSFVSNHADAAQRLEEHTLKHQWASARSLLHKLRGVAGALCMNELMEVSGQAELEIELSESISDKALDSINRSLARSIEEAQAYITSLQPEISDVKSSADIRYDNDGQRAALGELLTALDSDDLSEIEQALSVAVNRLPQEVVDQVTAEVEQFQFRRAEDVVKHYLDSGYKHAF
ncbi:response regulator [Vibrio sp. Isolate23]|uniref:response regulator n=1 Tax=Vibrio sp. Isolate23 TaxID=2908533 RepID=UPI001EFE29F2|nr:response regulator [Vibrio sp. Isolate23]MCG9682463.1 response regulator [Vibrio sp. Isolate23]